MSNENELDLKKLRKEIDSIDTEILKLFEKRMNVIKDITEYKLKNNLEIFDKCREESMLKKNLTKLNSLKYSIYYKEILNSFLNVSKAYQKSIFDKHKNENENM